VPLDPSPRLITQLRSYLLAGHEVDTHLVQEATNRIVQSFRAWDTDGSGSLSRSEFAKAMAVIGFHCTSEELLSLFEQLDADGSGTIAYAELLGALRDATPGTTPSRPAVTGRPAAAAKDTDLHASEYMVSTHELAPIESARVQWVDGRSMTGQISDLLMGQMREVVDAFQKWDTDGSNSLTHAEFARAMAALGLKSSQKVEQLWKEFDSDGNGSISFDELRMALDPPKLGAARSTDGGLMSISRAYTPGKSVSKETILKGMRVGPTVAMRSASSQMHEAFEEIATDRVVDVFKAWDVDNNGTLSRTEFARAMVRMGVKASRAELFKLFSELDPDGSWIGPDQLSRAPLGHQVAQAGLHGRERRLRGQARRMAARDEIDWDARARILLA
jgi:Ca2+-binding EF-hand superfamily protein